MPTFDTFVSYNRRHSNFARRIAEILRSNGLSVWFDEYEMLKFTKAATNSKEVSVAISDGVAQSASGLLITNDDYLTSSPCMSEEACPLLSRHPQIPIFHHSEPLTESAEGALSRLASHPEVRERGCRSWEDVVAELARFFKREIRVPHTASSMPSRDYNWHINAHEFVFDVTGWDISSEKISVQSGDAAGPQLWRTIDGVRLGINVTVGKNGNTRADIESTWKNETADSRWKYYEYAIGQAQWFVTGRNRRMEEKLGQVNEPVWNTIKRNTTLLAMRLVLVLLGIRGAGIHLYHHPHFGIDHFAVTHHMRWLGWFRTYSIFVPDRSGGSDFEFVFTANCNGTFEDFCRYVHLFDDVVLSLNYSVP